MKPDISPPALAATNDNAPEEVLDVDGAASLLRVGRDAIYSGCARRDIPHRRVGKALRFSRAALMRWLDSRAEQKEP